MPAAAVHVPLEVYRFTPGLDSKPRYDSYSLDLPPHTPILTALLRIREEVDPTLSLRYSCRSAICGSCAMVVNGKSRLACKTPIGPELERYGKVVIDPMRNMPVVRDLVTGMDGFWERYRRIEPALKPDPEHPMPADRPSVMTPKQVERFQETPRCIACAACYSACPAVEADPAFPGPMALAKLYRFVVDPRDGATRDRLLRIQTDGLWLCLRCHLCTEACPKDVRPSERIRDLKELSTQLRAKGEAGSRHASAFKENIREAGILNEFKLARETYGVVGLVGQLPQGTRIARKKPEVRKKPKPIEGLDEVRKLYELLDRPEESKEGP